MPPGQVFALVALGGAVLAVCAGRWGVKLARLGGVLFFAGLLGFAAWANATDSQ